MNGHLKDVTLVRLATLTLTRQPMAPFHPPIRIWRYARTHRVGRSYRVVSVDLGTSTVESVHNRRSAASSWVQASDTCSEVSLYPVRSRLDRMGDGASGGVNSTRFLLVALARAWLVTPLHLGLLTEPLYSPLTGRFGPSRDVHTRTEAV